MSIAKKNLVYSLAEKILRAGLTFISLGVVARYLGPSEFGHLSFLLAVIVYFQLFSVCYFIVFYRIFCIYLD